VLEVLEVLNGKQLHLEHLEHLEHVDHLCVTLLPPFAVPPIRFPCRALAARAGRASLGGEREVAMAALMVARLAGDALGPRALEVALREERAAAAKAWLASIAVPARARPALGRALDATARDAAAIATALEELAKVAGAWLDDLSVTELRAITAAPLVISR